MDIPRRGHKFCFLLPGSRRRTLYSYNYAILLSVHVCRLYSWVASSPTLAQFNCRGSFGPRSGGGDPSYLAVWLRGRAHSDWVSEWVEGHTQKMTRTTCSWCMSSSVHKQFLGVLYFAFKSLLLLLFYGLLRGTISIYGKLYFLHSNKIYIMHLSLSLSFYYTIEMPFTRPPPPSSPSLQTRGLRSSQCWGWVDGGGCMWCGWHQRYILQTAIASPSFFSLSFYLSVLLLSIVLCVCV